MNKVLPGEIFIPISFNVKTLAQINPQQMSDTFPNSSCVNCMILINLDAVHKGWKFL